MRIISVVNLAGGVGKTTSVINIAAVLQAKHKKVLLLDLDPQCNLTQGFGLTESENNICKILKKELPLEKAIQSAFGVDIIPAGKSLKYADSDFATRRRREFLLADLLELIRDNYDYILFDTQTNMYLLTENAIIASDYYLVPMQAEFYALKGLDDMLGSVEQLKKETRIKVKLAGVFLTRYNPRKKLCREIASVVEESMPDTFFKTYIRENIAISEAQTEGMPIFQFDIQREAESNGAADYIALTEELLTKLK